MRGGSGAPTVLVVAPEPAEWLAPLAREAPRLAGVDGAEVVVLAPWAVGRALGALPLARLARRRPALPARVTAQPGWIAVEAALAAWARGDAARRLRARFALRRAVDRLAARMLDGQVAAVFAPNGAALRTFAAADARGVARFLVADLPSLRRLHADLDAAARVHPDARFLQRFRAPARVIARAEAEQVLATGVLARGDYARAALVAGGVPTARILRLPEPLAPSPPPARPPSVEKRVLLAGPAAARNGSYEALAALDALPSLTLLVRAGEGLEPARLLAHPRVRRAAPDEIARLDGVAAVVAPAWCESYPAEVRRARAAGVPALTTPQAAGFADGDPRAGLRAGDSAALAAALAAAV